MSNLWTFIITLYDEKLITTSKLIDDSFLDDLKWSHILSYKDCSAYGYITLKFNKIRQTKSAIRLYEQTYHFVEIEMSHAHCGVSLLVKERDAL